MQLAKPGERYKAVPMFLSSGKSDPIALPAQHEQVKLALVQAGFRHVRLESYDGGHELDSEGLRAGLKWFDSLRPAAPVIPTAVVAPARPPSLKPATQKTAADAKLLEWQRKEAKAGRVSAQLALGLRYLSGEGVEPNEDVGRGWLLKAAQSGDNEAYSKLRNSDYLAERKDPTGRIVRSTEARRDFMKATGFPNGKPGYVITHLVPRSGGGCDCRENLQWQSVGEARQAETWEE
jgi:TPR repeat protein